MIYPQFVNNVPPLPRPTETEQTPKTTPSEIQTKPPKKT